MPDLDNRTITEKYTTQEWRNRKFEIDEQTQNILDDYNSETPPVNLYEICEDYGFSVSSLTDENAQELFNLSEFSETHSWRDIEGALFRVDDSEQARIFFKGTSPYTRQRFTVAHELGHFFLSHQQKNEILFRSMLSSSNPNNPWSETEANHFAACILMPREAIKIARLAGLSFLEELELFQVSEQSLRLRKRGLVREL